jgi:hypothetical protein
MVIILFICELMISARDLQMVIRRERIFYDFSTGSTFRRRD